MKYNFVEAQNKKILIFTDQHFGHSKDNPFKLKQTEKCMEWIISTGKKNHVDYVIFMGDLWEQRFALSVKTMNVAIKCVEELATSFEKVFLIVGNHDTYYKNTNEINSIDFLKMISRNENIEIINVDPYYMTISGKTFGLFPWGSNIKEIYSDQTFNKCDYAFGHFALNGIEMTGGLSVGEKYEFEDIFHLSNIVFSGHYHKNKLYKSLKSEDARIINGRFSNAVKLGRIQSR